MGGTVSAVLLGCSIIWLARYLIRPKVIGRVDGLCVCMCDNDHCRPVHCALTL